MTSNKNLISTKLISLDQYLALLYSHKNRIYFKKALT